MSTEIITNPQVVTVTQVKGLKGDKGEKGDTPTITTINFIVPAGDIDSGTVSNPTLTSISDPSKGWGIDAHKDKVVRICSNDGSTFQYALVLSNTSNTLTFDDNLLILPDVTCGYRILPTLVLTDEELDSITAIDLRLNSCGVVLPNSTVENERRYAHIYNELTLNGDHTAVIMCRGAERQLRTKYGTLEHKYEGVRLHAHQLGIPHWDVLQVFNVKRFASAYWSVDEPIDSTTFAYLGDIDKIVIDQKKRFVSVDREGKRWARYTSLVPTDFTITFDALIEKLDGGSAIVEITIAKKEFETGLITILNQRIGVGRLSVAGQSTITVTVPVSLAHNDELICVARRDTGLINLQAGSSAYIKEL